MARASAPASLTRALRRPLVAARKGWSTIVLGALTTVLVFPVFLVDIGFGLDQSWAAALHMATQRRMEFGNDVVFTFGPLGFLVAPYMYFPLQGTAALVLRVPLMLVVACFLLSRLRRLLPLPIAFLAALPLTWAAGSTLLAGGEAVIVPLLVLVAVWVAHFARSDPDAVPMPAWTAPATGAAAGLLLLCKFDVGLEVLLLGLLVTGTDGWANRLPRGEIARRLTTYAGAFVLTVVVAWMVLRQPIGVLPTFLGRSWQVFIGFNDAMAASYGPSWEPGVALVSAGGVAFLLAHRAQQLQWRRAVPLVVLTTGALYLFAKQGFVRHDSHTLRYHALIVLLAIALAARGSRQLAAVISAIAVVSSVTIAGTRHLRDAPFLHPGKSIDMSMDVARYSLSSAKRLDRIAWGRTAIPIAYPVPATMIDRMRGHRAHIEPIESVLAWVHPEIRWQPVPVFQSYSAYSAPLDRLNARAYRSPEAPEFVLYERFAIDDRIARWESPEAMVAFLCHYRIVETSDKWQLFARRTAASSVPGGSGSCGKTRTALATSGRRGQPLRLNLRAAGADGDKSVLLVARFSGPGIRPGIVRRAWGLLTRPSPLWVRVDEDPVAHRFVVGTASAPHIVSVPACLRGALGTFDTDTFETLTFTDSPQAITQDPGSEIIVRVDAVPFTCD